MYTSLINNVTKRFLLLFLFVFSLSITSAKSTDKAKLVFEKTTIDLGEVKLNTTTRVDFKFKNKGKKKLVIERVFRGCPCLDAEYPKDPIPKSGKGKITLILNTNDLPLGTFQKNVTVLSNSEESSQQLVLKIKIVL